MTTTQMVNEIMTTTGFDNQDTIIDLIIDFDQDGCSDQSIINQVIDHINNEMI